MNENPITVEFEAAAAKCRDKAGDDRVDVMLAALRDASRDLADAGFGVSLEVRPRLQGSDSPLSSVSANATLRVDDTVVDWFVKSAVDYRGNYNDSRQQTILSGFAAKREIGSFISERLMYGEDKRWTDPAGLKEKIITLVLQAKAEQDIYSEYNVGAQPVSLPGKTAAAPAGLRKKIEGAP